MNQTALEREVARADELVRQAERNVQEQRALIGTMAAGGLDTCLARVVLKTFEKSLELHIAERARLRTAPSKGSEAA